MTTIELADGRTVRIDPVGRGGVRIRTGADDTFPRSPLERYRLVRYPDLAPEEVTTEEVTTEAATGTAGDRVRITADGVTVEVDRSTAVVQVRGATGRVEVRLEPTTTTFALAEGDQLYGLGDASRESLDRRGRRLDTWVRNVVSYVPIPYVMNTAGWGVFVNSTRKVVFDAGHTRHDELAVTGTGPSVDVTVLTGGLAHQLDVFTGIVGRPALLPRSSYGLTFVCNENADARELLDDGLRFRAMDIPCDTLGLEPGWMSQHYDYGTDKRWHPERFRLPYWLVSDKGELDPSRRAETFLGAVERLGFRLSLWLCCDYDLSHEAERRALPAHHTADDAVPGADVAPIGTGAQVDPSDGDVEHDARLEPPVLMDRITKPDEPWFAHLRTFVDQGVGAFKLDGANAVMEHPDRAWGNGMRDDEMHNLYPALLAQQMHDGFVAHTGRRAMVYGSTGFTGAPRYVATWAGDTGGGPGPLTSMLNLGLSGHSNSSCDMDVFSKEGIHFGFLQPWSQVCSWAYWRHPWLLGEELEPIFRRYADLRQRLLPYVYTAARTATDTGLPVMRAMPLAHPEDVVAGHLGPDLVRHQYLLGDDLLVGAFTDRVWLPPGEWVDWWTGDRHHGGIVTAPALPPDRGGPLFVRAGAVLPTWPTARHARSTPAEIGWEVHPGPDRSATLYEDDGDTPAHLDGEFALTDVSTRRAGDDLDVVIGPRRGRHDGMPADRTHRVRLVGVARCDGITVDGIPADGATVRNPDTGTDAVECAVDEGDGPVTVRFGGAFAVRD